MEITADGLAVLQELRTLVHRHEKAWMSGLMDAELRTYIELHHRIQDSLADSTDDAG